MKLWGIGKKKAQLVKLHIDAKQRECLRYYMNLYGYGNSDAAIDNLERLAEVKNQCYLLEQAIGPHTA